jgi:hypothetical protein
LRASALAGAVESVEIHRHHKVVVRGWAVDTERNDLPRSIAAFYDGRLLGVTRTTDPRPDVAAAFHQVSVLHAGFHLEIRPELLTDLVPARLRVFAVAEGVASELSPSKGGLEVIDRLFTPAEVRDRIQRRCFEDQSWPVLTIDQGDLTLASVGYPAVLLLPPLPKTPARSLIARIDLTLPAPAKVHLAWKRRGQRTYSSTQTATRTLAAGRQVIHVGLPHRDVVGQLQLTIEDASSRYRLHEIEVRVFGPR